MGIRNSAGPVRTRIGARGTLVVPAALRQRLGLADGTPVLAEERDGGLFVRATTVEDLSDRERELLLSGAAAAYAALRADEASWAEEEAERALWQQAAGETLPREVWTERDFV